MAFAHDGTDLNRQFDSDLSANKVKEDATRRDIHNSNKMQGSSSEDGRGDEVKRCARLCVCVCVRMCICACAHVLVCVSECAWVSE